MTLDHLQVFYREATAVRTEVVAYLAEVEPDASDAALRGHVEGPLAAHAKTLPLRVPFEVRAAAGSALMATAVVTETCFWEPGAPHWYDVRVSLCRGDEVVDEAQRSLGVRPFSVTAEGLRLNGRPHVVRAASSMIVTDKMRVECFREKLALAVESATDVDMASASETGLPLIVRAAGSAPEVVAELRRLSHWPAVLLAIVETDAAIPESLQLECPNLLLAETAVKGRPLADWAHLAIVDQSSEIDLTRVPVPVIQRLSGQAAGSLDERIAAAATFQPDADETADHGQVVGCIV